MKKFNELTIKKRLKEHYPKGIELNYVDYRESFDESKELMEELATTGFMESIFEKYDWLDQWSGETMDYIKKEIFTEEEREQIEEDDELFQYFNDLCYEMDISEPLEQMLKNTSNRFFYYDLNHYVDLSNYHDEDRYEEEGKKIAKLLKVDYKKYKNRIEDLLLNSFDGGQLVILFTANPRRLYGEKKDIITFDGRYEILIIDRGQGSGTAGDGFTVDWTLALQFKRENLHDDDGAEGYSYSGEVCGMYKWEEEAEINFVGRAKDVVIVEENEDVRVFAEKEKRYQKTYDEGGCTAGDINFSRHRNVEYINEYPCRNQCKDCGQRWID